MGRPLRFGAQVWAQSGTWPELRDAAVALERHGWDLVLTWDHLAAIEGPWEQPAFEGWSLLAAWAALTHRVELGLLVGANTFRAPALTAKLATTLDHISGGRAILGLGAAWFEREHAGYGLDFGTSVGQRLERLDEALGIIRRLLSGERFDHTGPGYQLHDAFQSPRPVRAKLPLLVGGSGPRRTLRIVARHADAWDTSGSIEDVARNDAILREHCAAVGRDEATIARIVHMPIVLRDTRAAAEKAMSTALRHNGVESLYRGQYGSPGQVAERLRPYIELGFSTIVNLLPAPFDGETIARLAELREELA